ncbi:MAG TPA: deoxyhypusine synthase [Polyangia bacterium]|nr:deoxyhypusine synthase [Polyangia bacterium]
MLHPKRRIRPPPLDKGSKDVASLIDTYFNAYNAARLREACQTFARMIDGGATIGVSITGALTPAGLSSVLVPLLQNGFIDYVSSTGANLYHDLHFDLGLALYRGMPEVASGAHDVTLRKDGIIRVYDVLFEADVLYKTDEWVYRVMMAPEFGKRMSGSELHYLIGKYALATAKETGVDRPSLLGACHDLEVPIWVASPGDSTIGLNMSAIHTADPERGPHVDPAADVMEMAALVLDAKRNKGGLSGVLIFGGGAPKNFLLQTEPQLQEILGVAEKGHDYFIQITDARPDTGGLSGATPAEAVSWGKIDPDKLPDTVVCYIDSTVAMPLLASYVLSRCKPRKPRRLYKRLPRMVEALRSEYRKTELYARHWPAQETKKETKETKETKPKRRRGQRLP